MVRVLTVPFSSQDIQGLVVGGITAGCGGSAPLNMIAFKTLMVSLEWLPPCGFVVVVITDVNCMSCLVVISAQPRSRSGSFTISSYHLPSVMIPIVTPPGHKS